MLLFGTVGFLAVVIIATSLTYHAHAAALDAKSVVVGVGLTLAAQQVLKGLGGTGYGTANAACGATRCGQPKRPPCSSFQFTETVNSIPTQCVCTSSQPGTCKATTYQNISGGSSGVGGLDQFLGKLLGDTLGKLLQGGGGQGGGSQGSVPQQQYPPCVLNTATNTVSPIPCTDTNGSINYGTSAPTNTTLGGTVGGSTADILLNALNGGSGTDAGNVNTNTNTNNISATASDSSSTAEPTAQTKVIIHGGQGSLEAPKQQGLLQGDIVIGGSGGMLYVRSRDAESNTEVAGFYGGNTLGQSQSSSLIGRMCSTRPWGGGVLGGLISGTFFDGLCLKFGYQVGAIALTPGGGGSTTKRPVITITQNPVSRPATTSAPVIRPEVDIWANPSSVRLGTRTYIFWNTSGVDSCVQAGPNFSHNTLSGGASTVPLSDASTFTIECKTADGQTVSDSARVNLAL